jgi:ATP-dependent DNA helicase DinG
MDIHQYIDLCFSEDGELSSRIKRYQVNNLQIEYAHAVADVLTHKSAQTSVGLLEADTGTGKSLGYLIPASWMASKGKLVAVSTFTNHLLRQNLEDVFPVVKDVCASLTGKIITAAPRFGMRNFISKARALRLLEEMDSKESASFARWIKRGGVLFDEWVEKYGDLPAGVNIDAICCRFSDSEEELTPYADHIDVAKRADIIFTNHHLSILHVVGRNVFEQQKRLSSIILDEADSFPSAAASIVSKGSSLGELKSLFNHAIAETSDSYLSNRCTKTLQEIEDIRQKIGNIKPDNRSMLPIHHKGDPSSVLAGEVIDAIDDFRKYLSKSKKGHLLGQEWIDNLGEHRNILGLVYGSSWAANAVPVVSWSEVYEIPSFRLVPINPGRALSRYSQEYGKRKPVDSIILTSATLSDGRYEHLNMIAKEYGIFDEAMIVRADKFEPDHFGSVDFVLADPSLPHPTDKDDIGRSNEQWLNNCRDMIIDAASRGERVLVLTLSSRDTEDLAERLDGDTLLIHRKDVKFKSLLKTFREVENSVLVTHSAWEGVDLPGLVKNLVITRLPFSPPGKQEDAAMEEWFKKAGYSEKAYKSIIYAISLSRARRKFRQGFGRAIRSKNDHSTIWICDPRFEQRKAFVSSLPKRFILSSAGSKSALEKAKLWCCTGELIERTSIEKPANLSSLSW